jgi:hypothetical protein
LRFAPPPGPDQEASELTLDPDDWNSFGRLVPGGRERSVADFRHLLEQSGFKITRIIPTESPFSIIEAHPVA